MAKLRYNNTKRTRTRAAIGAVIVAAIVAGWLSWRRSGHTVIQHGMCRGCNVLLITIDTLRSDRVGAFGGPPGLAPTLDRLAAEGLRLTRAYTSAPLTLPSHTSILTAVSPPVHGVRANGLFRLGAKLPTLATVLKAAGYRTAAFVGAFVLDARFGLNRGFDVYDDRYGEKRPGDDTEGAERRGEDVIKPATAWILAEKPTSNAEAQGAVSLSNGGTRNPEPGTRPSTLREPQARPEAARGTTGSGRRELVERRNPEPGVPNSEPRTQNQEPQTRPSTGSGRRELVERRNPEPRTPWFAWVHLYDPHEPYRAPEPYASRHAPYDAEVAYTDATIGRLIGDLDAARELDRTLVVVVADHGESLGEHGERSHGVFAYDATLRVPWILWAGARFGGHTWDGVSRLIDVAPTVLDLIGVASPSAFEGRSLVAAMAAGETVAPPAYFEAMDANLTRNWAPLTGIITGHEKLIDLPLPELYDLDADPHETTNLFTGAAERARTLQLLLRTATAEFVARGSASEKTTLSADARQRLQALGYVGSTAETGHRVHTDADDPKTLIAPANALDRALADFKGGSHDQAMAVVHAIVQAHPGFSTAYGVLASMQHDSGDLGGAIGTLEQVVRRGIADQSVMVVLGGYLQEAGALQKAADLLEAVVAAHPDYADAYNSLGVVYSRQGRHDRARAAFRKILEVDPTSATSYENLGVDELAAGDLSAAVTDLTRALDLDPRLARAHNALAAAYMRQAQKAEAIRHWEIALQLDPNLYDALYNIGVSLWDDGRRAEARPYLERFLREAPSQRYTTDLERIRHILGR